jgi:phage portal protein BeeE
VNLAQYAGTFLPERVRPASSSLQRYSVDDYASWLGAFNFGGLQYGITGPSLIQTLADGEKAESIGHSFGQYADGAFSSSPVVFACTLLRTQVFSQARFLHQRMRNGRPGDLFPSAALGLLERPWLHGTTATLLAQMEIDVSLAGNFYGAEVESELVRLRPDWVNIILAPRMLRETQLGYKRVAYTYTEGGMLSGETPVLLLPDEIVHYAPYPDPKANFMGMSWLTPAIREVISDKAATTHKLKFWENGATPNMVVRTDPTVVNSLGKFRDFVKAMDDQHKGLTNAYKTLYLAGAADATVVGSDFQQMDFRNVQGLSETRIAAAAGTHPVIVGLSEGMQGSALNAGNYAQARRRFADTTMQHLWTSAAAALEHLVPPPPSQFGRETEGSTRLWFDKRGIPFLRDDSKDEAEILGQNANAIRTLVDGGFEAESVKAAIVNNDLSLLVHTGKTSVQLIDNSGGDEATRKAQAARDAVDVIRQVYLGTEGNIVVTPEEARQLVNDVGATLDPNGLPEPITPEPVIEEPAQEAVPA